MPYAASAPQARSLPPGRRSSPASPAPVAMQPAVAQGGTRSAARTPPAWEIDWRKRFHGRALAIAQPGATKEVAELVRACAAAGVSIVPQGGHTGLVGGGTPDASGGAGCCDLGGGHALGLPVPP